MLEIIKIKRDLFLLFLSVIVSTITAIVVTKNLTINEINIGLITYVAVVSFSVLFFVLLFFVGLLLVWEAIFWCIRFVSKTKKDNVFLIFKKNLEELDKLKKTEPKLALELKSNFILSGLSTFSQVTLAIGLSTLSVYLILNQLFFAQIPDSNLRNIILMALAVVFVIIVLVEINTFLSILNSFREEMKKSIEDYTNTNTP